MDKKIDQLIEDVVYHHKSKLEEIVNVCDSPIEKVMLLLMIEYFMKDDAFDDTFSYLTETEYIDPDQTLSDLEKKEKHCSNKKFSFNRIEKISGVKYRFSGIEFKEERPAQGYSWKELQDKTSSSEKTLAYRFFEIIPQHLLVTENECFFIDIAIISKLKHEYKRKVEVEFKLAIECDGHNFHSTKDAIKRDNSRTRKLQADGWIISRYSGSEINSMNLNSFEDHMEQIFSIIYTHIGIPDNRNLFKR